MDRTRRTSQALSGVAVAVLAATGLMISTVGLTGCASAHKGADAKSAELTEVAHLMTGAFSSAEQAAADHQFYDVHLHMVPIWTERTDGVWIYVEQAMADEPTHPYRQRVYHLEESEPGAIVTTVYTLPDEKKWVGMWEKPHKFSKLKIEKIVERGGCSMTVRREGDGAFAGGTDGTGCPFDQVGASYVTSQLRLTEAGLDAWDRGFDGAGAQVWGPTTGPYRFLRITQE